MSQRTFELGVKGREELANLREIKATAKQRPGGENAHHIFKNCQAKARYGGMCL
jgi:hypothetical protein